MKLPWSIAAARQAIVAGSLKPSNLVAECLRRIDRWDPRVQAWVVVDRERALAEAHRLDALGHDQLAALPLGGIPLGIKDIVDVAGLPTRSGSPLTSAEPAAKDATAVARLRAAGAIILGKTVTTEFASLDPAATHNPWNLAHTPGGSSSGSAAALALGMCLGAIGSQTAGSVIRPAAFCGVSGIKPTLGRIDLGGMLVSCPSLDHVGALAASAADLEILWKVLADPLPPLQSHASAAHGEQAGEQHAAEHHHLHWHLPGHHHAAHAEPRFPERAPKLGIVRGLLAEASPEVLLVTEMTLGWLESHGVELCVANLPADLDEIDVMHRTLMTVEMARYHRDKFTSHRAQFGRKISAFIEEGLAVDEARYQAAREHQRALQLQLSSAIAGVDGWVSPATKTTAPASLDTTGDPRANTAWTYGGVPTITIPSGVAPDGMPVGLQLIGPAGGDDLLLSIARWCEDRVAFADGPKLLAEAE